MYCKSVVKFLKNEPLFEFGSTEHIGIKELEYYDLLIRSTQEVDNFPIFLIGPWGSGKTAALREFQKDHKSKFYIVERNYFGVRNVDEAVAHLIGIGWRLLLFICILLFLFCLYQITRDYLIFGKDVEAPFLQAVELKGIIGLILIFMFSFVVRPQSRMLFLGTLALQFPFYWIRSLILKKKTIIIIEDLDRSSLSVPERFIFLSQLPPLPVKYVISYGHNSESEYLTLVEYINKINGIAINLRQDQNVTFEILKKHISYFPFLNSAKWMSEISIRELLGVFYSTERRTTGKRAFEKKIELILSIFDLLKTKKIKYTTGRDDSDLQILFTGGKFKLDNPQINFTRYEGEVLNSFFASIDLNYFQNSFAISVAQKDKDSASNWMEIAWRRVTIDNGYREFIASKV